MHCTVRPFFIMPNRRRKFEDGYRCPHCNEEVPIRLIKSWYISYQTIYHPTAKQKAYWRLLKENPGGAPKKIRPEENEL